MSKGEDFKISFMGCPTPGSHAPSPSDRNQKECLLHEIQLLRGYARRG